MAKRTGVPAQSVKLRIMENAVIWVRTGCWIWTASTTTGYGQMWIGSHTDRSRRRALAHRVSYETFVGPIPQGMDVDHLCRIHECVNPAHLEAVTRQENLRRRDTVVRAGQSDAA